ncbi:MAG: hypothetical protein MK371_01770 [SAR86 cluster bacterium]|nr:hypothetical protein [SAR86 cluster bacterium]
MKGLMAITTQITKVDKIKKIKFSKISGPAEKLSLLKNNTLSVKPKTRAIFATLEPTTLPTTITALPSSAANRLVNISGVEVPKAITVDPMKKGDIPYLVADKTEYFARFCPLATIRIIPVRI